MKKRTVWILGFALFSLFFGAGNLILPPQLGLRSGSLWWLALLGFCLSAVGVPMLGILAHARLQGSMFDFARKVSPRFSLVYCYVVYAISLSLPSPRTASVTHEMAIVPYFDVPSWVSSLLYFGAIYGIAVNRSRLNGFIGKWLTPIILFVLVLLIGNMLWGLSPSGVKPLLSSPVSAGFLEGYQTFDAIGAVVVGGVILVSLRLEQPGLTTRLRFRAVTGAGWIAGLSLLVLYAGLMYSGALMQGHADPDSTRTGLLGLMSIQALGRMGSIMLGILIALACFTTAAGIVTGTADFLKSRFGDSERAYRLTALTGCLLGVAIGQGSVEWIISIAVPALMFVYPLTIVLIGLNALPPAYTPPSVFRAVVLVTLLFSIPDFLGSLGIEMGETRIVQFMPLHGLGLAWLPPAVATYLLAKGWRLAGRHSFSQERSDMPEK